MVLAESAVGVDMRVVGAAWLAWLAEQGKPPAMLKRSIETVGALAREMDDPADLAPWRVSHAWHREVLRRVALWPTTGVQIPSRYVFAERARLFWRWCHARGYAPVPPPPEPGTAERISVYGRAPCVLWYPDDRLAYVSNPAARLLGLLDGLSLRTAYRLELVHRDDRARAEAYGRAVAQGCILRGEDVFRLASGVRVRVLSMSSFLEDGRLVLSGGRFVPVE